MKTEGLYYAAPGRVELREFELGDPEANQVQIELKVTGLCAYDLSLYQGVLPSYLAFPFLHGHEGVGIVKRVGADVSSVKEGNRVAAMGNSARLLGHYSNVDESLVARLPDDARPLEEWLAEPVACVVNGLDWTPLQAGDRVAVIGAGFMGLLLIQGLRYTLNSRVVAVDIDDLRLELAKQFGVGEAINPQSPQGQRRLDELKHTPFDIVIESAGSQPALDLSYEIVRPGGVLNIFSSHRGSGSRSVDIYEWHHKGIRVFNTSPKISPDFGRVFQRTIPLMKKGVFDLAPLISHRAAPPDAHTLYETALAKRENYLKGVVVW